MSGSGPVGALREFLRRRVAEGRMPGAAWWVGGPRGVAASGVVGCAVQRPEVRARIDTPYDLASLTKPLATAPLLVLLEQEGRLDLEAPLEAFLPESSGSPYGSLGLLSFATHRSGLPAWWPLYLEAGAPAETLAAILKRPRAVVPGSTLYSDLGYMLLGFVLERVTGAGLDRLFRERIALPLALERTGFVVPSSAFADAAATERGNRYERELAGAAGAGHAWRRSLIRGEAHDANAWRLDGVAGHAGLFGTVEEVARLACELLRPRVLPLERRARARLLRPDPAAGTRTVGFVTAAGSSAARGILPDASPGHTGFTGTSLWLDPGRDAALLLLTNRVHPRVEAREFRHVRRGFHRLALGLLDGAGSRAGGATGA